MGASRKASRKRGTWGVSKLWVEVGHVKVGGRAFGAAGVTEEKARRQKSTRCPRTGQCQAVWKVGSKRGSDVKQSLQAGLWPFTEPAGDSSL